MSVTDLAALKIHGYIFDTSSISDGDKSEFDEEYYTLRPPPLTPHELPSKTVKIYPNSEDHQQQQAERRSPVSSQPKFVLDPSTLNTKNYTAPKPPSQKSTLRNAPGQENNFKIEDDGKKNRLGRRKKNKSKTRLNQNEIPKPACVNKNLTETENEDQTVRIQTRNSSNLITSNATNKLLGSNENTNSNRSSEQNMFVSYNNRHLKNSFRNNVNDANNIRHISSKTQTYVQAVSNDRINSVQRSDVGTSVKRAVENQSIVNSTNTLHGNHVYDGDSFLDFVKSIFCCCF